MLQVELCGIVSDVKWPVWSRDDYTVTVNSSEFPEYKTALPTDRV